MPAIPSTLKITNVSGSPVNVPGGSLAVGTSRDLSIDLLLAVTNYQTLLSNLVTAGSITASFMGATLTAQQIVDLELTIGVLGNGQVKATTGSLTVYANGTNGNDAYDGFTALTPKKTIQAAADLIPYYVNDNCLISLSGAFSEFGKAYIEKHVAKDRVLIVDFGDARVPMDALGGIGTGVAGFVKNPVGEPTNTVELTVASGANLTTNLVGKSVVVQDVITQGNGGSFTITKIVAPNQIYYLNSAAPASPENFSGRWTILPFDSVNAGMGTQLDAVGGVVTLTTSDAPFTAATKGKKITIAGATTSAHNITAVITAVLGSNQVQWANGASLPASEAFTGTWTLGGYVSDSASLNHIGMTTATAWGQDAFEGLQVEILASTNPVVIGQRRTVHANDVAETGTVAKTGTGDSYVRDEVAGVPDKFTFDAYDGMVSLYDASASFTSALVGKSIVVASTTTPGNSGTFTVTSVQSSTVLTYTNVSGHTEVGAGTYKLTLSATVTLTDSAATFLQTMVGRKISTTGSTTPGNDVTNAVITAVLSQTKLTYANASGVTESFTGTWTLERTLAASGSTVTLTDCGAEFSIRMVGKKVTIAGATTPNHNGTFLISAVLGVHQITYSNTNGGLPASETFGGAWTTENGWVTPGRNWSVTPGINAEFRFVRPATELKSSATAEFRPRNLGAGTLAVQGFYTSGNTAVIAQGSPGFVYFADIVLNSLVQGLITGQFQAIDMGTMAFSGARYSTATFLPLDANTNAWVGVSSVTAPVTAILSITLRGVQNLTVSGMVIRNIIAPMKVQQQLYDSGCRFGSVVMVDTYTFRNGQAFRTTTGYASMRFGGHGICYTFALAGVVAGFNSGAHIGTGAIFEDCYYHGIEANHSALGLKLFYGRKIRGLGVYAWNQSNVRMETAPLGYTGYVGDIGFNYVVPPTKPTPAGTWVQIDAGNVLKETDQMSMAFKGTQLY